LPHGAFHLDVAGVAHEHDLVALAREALRLDVDLGDEGAGGVDHAQPAGRRGGAHGRRDAVRAEHEQGALGRLGRVLDEDGALGAQRLDHVAVVDDLVADVDGRPEALETLLHDLDGAVDPGAEAARTGEQDLHGSGQTSIRPVRRPPPERLHSPARAAGARAMSEPTPDLEAFRAELRAWLEQNAPQSLRGATGGELEGIWGGRKATWPNPDAKRWLDACAERGLTAPEWPRAYGGGGLSRAQAKIWRQ